MDDETSPSFYPMPELARLAAMTAEQLNAHESAVASRFQTVVQLFDSQETAWPTKTDEMCRWCFHRFDWFPIGIPVRFDEQRHKMVLSGYFCSFACAHAHICESKHRSYYTDSATWLEWLAKRAFGLSRINRAPPRELLNRMTIEEFRAASGEAVYDTAVPECKAQLALFERDREIVVVRKLVSKQDEAAQVALREDAIHAERCAKGGGKRKRRETTTTTTTTVETSDVTAISHSDEPPLMPAHWVKTLREQDAKKQEKTGILNMLGATRKPPPS